MVVPRQINLTQYHLYCFTILWLKLDKFCFSLREKKGSPFKKCSNWKSVVFWILGKFKVNIFAGIYWLHKLCGNLWTTSFVSTLTYVAVVVLSELTHVFFDIFWTSQRFVRLRHKRAPYFIRTLFSPIFLRKCPKRSKDFEKFLRS